MEAPEGEAAAVENAEEPTQVAMAAEGDAPAPSPAAASTAPPKEPAPQLSSDYFQQLAEARDALVASCLLYTSPSPRDVEESRMPSSA